MKHWTSDFQYWSKLRIAKYMSIIQLKSFDDFWKENILSTPNRYEIEPQDIDGKKCITSNEVLKILPDIEALCEDKTQEWMSIADLKNEVPSDCESIAEKIWTKYMDLLKNAKFLMFENTPLIIQRRMNKETGKTIVCLERSSFPLFLKSVKKQKQSQIEKSIMNMINSEREIDPYTNF